jgi:hypothetical protein
MPPTPTPLPDTAAPLNMPEISLWNYTDTAIQAWNSSSEVTIIFQAIILVGIIMFIAMALYQRMNHTTANEE